MSEPTQSPLASEPAGRVDPISDRRQLLLRITLLIGAPAAVMGVIRNLSLPASSTASLTLSGLLAVLMLVALILSFTRRVPLQSLAFWTVAAFAIFNGLRTAMLFVNSTPEMSAGDILPAHGGWMPMVFVLSFMLLPYARALWLSVAYYLLLGLPCLWWLWRQTQLGYEPPTSSLLQQFILGHALYIVVMSMVPRLQSGFRQASSEAESLREAQVTLTRIADVFDASPDALISVDHKHRIVTWNPAANYLFGYRRDTVLDKPVDFLHPQFKWREQIPQRIERGASPLPLNTLVEVTAADGSERTATLRLVPFYDDKGDFAGAAAFYRYVEDEEQMRRQLLEVEQRFVGAFAASSIGMALVSLEGVWLDVNPALCQIVGYERDELLKVDFQTITHPEDLNADLELLQKTLAGEIDSYRMEKRYYHKRGHVVWIVLSVSLVRGADDEPRYFVSQIEDISDAKKAREELERSNKELAQFASFASHDLRAPLTGIGGFAGLLKRRYSDVLDETGRGYVKTIEDSVKRADGLIQDLLDYARLDQPVEPQRVDVEAVLNEVRDDLSLAIEEAGAQINTSGELPAVIANNSDVRRLLQNLLSNAIKYRHPNRAPVIHITAQRRSEWVEYSVVDNGQGIDPEYVSRVFDAFQRVPGATAKGSGVGLAICRRMVKRHGGSIELHSSVGEGSEFHFRLPAAD